MHMDMCPLEARGSRAFAGRTTRAHTHGNKNTPAPSVDTHALNTQTSHARATPAPRKRRGVLAHSTFARESRQAVSTTEHGGGEVRDKHMQQTSTDKSAHG